MRKLELIITYKYKVEVNDEDDIVKEYKDDKELVNDCASYHFSPVLPVIAVNAVQVTDIQLVQVISIISSK